MCSILIVLAIITLAVNGCYELSQAVINDWTFIARCGNYDGLYYSFCLLVVMAVLGFFIYYGLLSLLGLTKSEDLESFPRLGSFLRCLITIIIFLPSGACIFFFYDIANILMTVVGIISIAVLFLLLVCWGIFAEYWGDRVVIFFLFLGVPLAFVGSILTAYALCSLLYLLYPEINWYAMLESAMKVLLD